jgi:hypothetical protein
MTLLRHYRILLWSLNTESQTFIVEAILRTRRDAKPTQVEEGKEEGQETTTASTTITTTTTSSNVATM